MPKRILTLHPVFNTSSHHHHCSFFYTWKTRALHGCRAWLWLRRQSRSPTNQRISDSLLQLTCRRVLGQETSPWMVSDGCVNDWTPLMGGLLPCVEAPAISVWVGECDLYCKVLWVVRRLEKCSISAVHFPYATFSVSVKGHCERMSPQQVDFVCVAPPWGTRWICDKLSLSPLSLLETLEPSERDVIAAKLDA